jgi:predicted enzyme related to lactoylglutathione lyase
MVHDHLLRWKASLVATEEPSGGDMGHITGIGGVFFRARRRQDLAAWYHETLGLPVTDAATARLGDTVWAAFDHDTSYFGPTRQDYMVNYRVDDLDAAIARLHRGGASVSPEIQIDRYGRFTWAEDPEGNRFELWEPVPGTDPEPQPEAQPEAPPKVSWRRRS